MSVGVIGLGSMGMGAALSAGALDKVTLDGMACQAGPVGVMLPVEGGICPARQSKVQMSNPVRSCSIIHEYYVGTLPAAD